MAPKGPHSPALLGLLEEALTQPPEQREHWLQAHCSEDQLPSALRMLAAAGATDAPLAPIAIDTTASLASQHGRRFGAYVLDEIIGQGGMGVVYRAHRADGAYEEQVAIKLISLARPTDVQVARFERERQHLSDLRHPNIATLLDGGTGEDGIPYLVMRFVNGQAMDRFVRERDPSLHQRLALFETICRAVQAAHQQRVIHRDLKPDNVLVDQDGCPQLIDFGIAKSLDPEVDAATRTQVVRLTPAYASPEQIRNEPLTPATDVYSLGVMLYELLTGKRPYALQGLSATQAEQVLREQSPPRPSTQMSTALRPPTPQQQRALDATVLRAIEIDPRRRFTTAGELADTIARLHQGELPRGGGSYLAQRASRALLRTPALRWALLALLAVGAFTLLPPPAPQAPVTARAPVATVATLAVLPFADASAAGDQGFLADGLSEEILNALARTNQLRVAGRASSFTLKAQDADVTLVGELLGVGYVLQGEVRRDETRLRVRAQLTQTSTGAVRWSETFEADLNAPITVEGDIARAVLLALGGTPQAVSATSPAPVPEVYNDFLMAKAHIYARTSERLVAAAQLLDRALARDPAYAPAWAQRGIAELLLADGNYGTTPVPQALRAAKAQFDQALSLDSTLAEGWAGLGLYHLTRQDEPAQAIEALRKALTLNPSLTNASVWLKNAYNRTGQFAAAREITLALVERDPLFGPAISAGVNAYIRNGEIEQSRALIERIAKLRPSDPSVLKALGVTHLYAGEWAEGCRLLEQALAQAPTNAEFVRLHGECLEGTGQYRALADSTHEPHRAFGLELTGQQVAAEALAIRLAEDGYVRPLLGYYNRQGRHGAVRAFVEVRWNSLEAFAESHPAELGDWPEMAELAVAYAALGQAPEAARALDWLGEALDEAAAQGFSNMYFESARARHFAMLGEQEQAMAALARAASLGWQPALPLAMTEPALASLAQHRDWPAVTAGLQQAVDESRASLGLDPLVLPAAP